MQRTNFLKKKIKIQFKKKDIFARELRWKEEEEDMGFGANKNLWQMDNPGFLLEDGPAEKVLRAGKRWEYAGKKCMQTD